MPHAPLTLRRHPVSHADLHARRPGRSRLPPSPHPVRLSGLRDPALGGRARTRGRAERLGMEGGAGRPEMPQETAPLCGTGARGPLVLDSGRPSARTFCMRKAADPAAGVFRPAAPAVAPRAGIGHPMTVPPCHEPLRRLFRPAADRAVRLGRCGPSRPSCRLRAPGRGGCAQVAHDRGASGSARALRVPARLLRGGGAPRASGAVGLSDRARVGGAAWLWRGRG